MRTHSSFKLANGVELGAQYNMGGGITLWFNESSAHRVHIELTKQKAGALKDALAKLDLVSNT